MEEKVLMEGVANPLSKHGFSKNPGRCILTNKRFIYCKHSMAKILAIGIWVNLTKGNYDYEIYLKDIRSASIDKFRFNHKLTITTNDGKTYQYLISKALEWQIAFGNALSGRDNEDDQIKGQELNEPAEPDTKPKKNFCSSCGAKLQKTDKFCPNCGAKV